MKTIQVQILVPDNLTEELEKLNIGTSTESIISRALYGLLNPEDIVRWAKGMMVWGNNIGNKDLEWKNNPDYKFFLDVEKVYSERLKR
jgi:hypothetical protein